MKYLRRFNENIDQSVIDECKDILLELEDNGFTTKISLQPVHPEYWLALNPHRSYDEREIGRVIIFTLQRSRFSYSDIEEVVERLKLFLSACGLHIQFQSPEEIRNNKPTIKEVKINSPMSVVLSTLHLPPEERDVLLREPGDFRNECKIHFISN
jgi:hypothetical protein